MRADLLALTAADLTAFSNRGLTRRAEQEAGAGTLSCEITESADGTVIVKWSDGVDCTLPAGARLADSRCSCPSTTLCRHVLRSVFAYQKRHAGAASGPAPSGQANAPAASAPTGSPGAASGFTPRHGPVRASEKAPLADMVSAPSRGARPTTAPS